MPSQNNPRTDYRQPIASVNSESQCNSIQSNNQLHHRQRSSTHRLLGTKSDQFRHPKPSSIVNATVCTNWNDSGDHCTFCRRLRLSPPLEHVRLALDIDSLEHEGQEGQSEGPERLEHPLDLLRTYRFCCWIQWAPSRCELNVVIITFCSIVRLFM